MDHGPVFDSCRNGLPCRLYGTAADSSAVLASTRRSTRYSLAQRAHRDTHSVDGGRGGGSANAGGCNSRAHAPLLEQEEVRELVEVHRHLDDAVYSLEHRKTAVSTAAGTALTGRNLPCPWQGSRRSRSRINTDTYQHHRRRHCRYYHRRRHRRHRQHYRRRHRRRHRRHP